MAALFAFTVNPSVGQRPHAVVRDITSVSLAFSICCCIAAKREIGSLVASVPSAFAKHSSDLCQGSFNFSESSDELGPFA